MHIECRIISIETKKENYLQLCNTIHTDTKGVALITMCHATPFRIVFIGQIRSPIQLSGLNR